MQSENELCKAVGTLTFMLNMCRKIADDNNACDSATAGAQI